MKIVARTDTGLQRNNNQDYYTACELSGGAVLAVVCDGMGGAAEGALASSTAVKIIRNRISGSYQEGMSDISIKSLLISSLENANKDLFNLSLTDSNFKGMGTTVVAMIATDEFIYIAHAGDSRAYKITGNNLFQLTKDHSVVQNMIENGEITADEAIHHPKKHIITRALGVDSDIRIDFCQEPFEDKDLIILCTDGLTNFCSTEDFINLTSDGLYFEYAERLVNTANSNGGGDNITVVAVLK